MENFEALATTIFYRNEKNYYSIFAAKVNGKTETLIGYFPILNVGLKLFCFGKKEKGRQNRMQYKIASYSIELPDNEYHLFQFLTNDFINMELPIASVISDKVGVSYLSKHQDFNYIKQKMKNDPLFVEYYDEIKRGSYQLSEIKRKLELMETMTKMGFSNDISAKVSFSDLKLTPDSIRTNPYQIIFPFDLEWNTIDTIAQKNGIEKTSEIRIHEGICYLLDEAVKRLAHIYLHREEVLKSLNNLLKMQFNITEFKKYEESLTMKKRIVCDVDDHIYGYRYFEAEKNLAKGLYRIYGQEPTDEETMKQVVKSIEEDDIHYAKEQEEAIITALKESLSIIIGPAGSGKTTTLRKIVEVIDSIYNKEGAKETYKLGLCAPTGRAAERMREVTGFEAKTIHSMLSHDPLSKLPNHNIDNPLNVDCMIIDEGSMMDTVLFSEVVNALKKDTKLIIVGDADQLPSIGPGNVLYELIHHSEFPVVQLETIFRQGNESPILELATKIRKGIPDVTDILSEKGEQFTFIEQYNPKQIADMIIHTAQLLLNKPYFDFYNDFQIITPMHKTEIGTIQLNRRIQELLNKKGRSSKVSFVDKDFYVGDKVMHTENNLKKKVFNGEIGKVKEIIGKKLIVEFANEKIISYEGDELFELELAFATTVHKMQGSETGILIFPIHSMFKRMLQRRLLYTGITRAKKRLLLIGESQSLISAIKIDTSHERNCNLQQRLLEANFEHMLSL